MAKSKRRVFSSLAVLAGLSLWTLAPYGGCSCNNPMAASAPSPSVQLYGGSQTLQALQAGKNPSPSTSPLVDDFEDGFTSQSATGHWQNTYINGALHQVWFNGNNPAYRVDLWGGGTYTQADAFGSQYASQLVAPGAGGDGSSSCLQFGSPTSMYGRTSPPLSCLTTTCGAIYPFVEHGMFLSPQNAAGDANVEFDNTGQPTIGGDNGTLSAHGLQITYNTLANTLVVKLKLLYLENYTNSAPCTNTDVYQYHMATLATTSGAWSTVQVPFNTFSMKPNVGSKPGYMSNGMPIGVGLIWGSTGLLSDPAARVDGNGNMSPTLRISAIEFSASKTLGGGTCVVGTNNFRQLPYDFQIDNVEFY